MLIIHTDPSSDKPKPIMNQYFLTRFQVSEAYNAGSSAGSRDQAALHLLHLIPIARLD
jgi:hypothetical protein